MSDNKLLTGIFEAIPSPTFLVDDDVRAIMANRAARTLIGPSCPENLRTAMKRGGDLLHCIHSYEHPDGCGRAAACKKCVIRNSVRKAFDGGVTAREGTAVELKGEQGVVRLGIVVSAAPVEVEDAKLAVLTIEPITG